MKIILSIIIGVIIYTCGLLIIKALNAPFQWFFGGGWASAVVWRLIYDLINDD